MKSTFPPFFHFTEFSADQFSKSTALIVKYVFTTYIMIKRYSKHLCTLYILSWHFHHYFWQRTTNLWTVSTNLWTVSTWKLYFILWKLVRWSNILPRFMPQMPGVACKGEEAFQHSTRNLERSPVSEEGRKKGKALTQESQRQIEDPETLKKGGREGRELSWPPLICKDSLAISLLETRLVFNIIITTFTSGVGYIFCADVPIRPDTKIGYFWSCDLGSQWGAKNGGFFGERPRGRGENNYFTKGQRPKVK